MLRPLLFTLAFILAACSSDGVSEGYAVHGDWFRCLDEGCTEIDRRGTRYAEDGNVYDLSGPQPQMFGPFPPFEVGDAYCVASPALGTWSYDAEAQTITITWVGEVPQWMGKLVLEGDDRAGMGARGDVPHLRQDNAIGTWNPTAMVPTCDVGP